MGAATAATSASQAREQRRLRCSLGDPVEIAAALCDLANVAVTLRDFDRAIALYQECLALCRANNNRFGMILPLMNLGACYHEMNRPQEALTPAKSASRLARRSHWRLPSRWRAASCSATCPRPSPSEAFERSPLSCRTQEAHTHMTKQARPCP